MRDFPHLPHVEGWLAIHALRFTEYFAARFAGSEFRSLEIGVHHGLFFIGIENITPPSCICVAADVFSDQELNIDRSGEGNKEIFLDNISKWAVMPERVQALQVDSIDLSAAELGIHSYGIISIDGGHTRAHTFNDLAIAQDLLAPNGLIILDDILNQDWCGVVTGALDFFNSPSTTRLVPIAIGFNKLFIAHFSVADRRIKEILSDRENLSRYGIRPHKMTPFGSNSIISLVPA